MRSYKFISKWRDSLIWCPSQLYRDFILRYQVGDLKPGIYTLYCRWRHEDPWTFDLFNVDVWIYLGSGLDRESKIKYVHTKAEHLLFDYLFQIEHGGLCYSCEYRGKCSIAIVNGYLCKSWEKKKE